MAVVTQPSYELHAKVHSSHAVDIEHGHCLQIHPFALQRLKKGSCIMPSHLQVIDVRAAFLFVVFFL